MRTIADQQMYRVESTRPGGEQLYLGRDRDRAMDALEAAQGWALILDARTGDLACLAGETLAGCECPRCVLPVAAPSGSCPCSPDGCDPHGHCATCDAIVYGIPAQDLGCHRCASRSIIFPDRA